MRAQFRFSLAVVLFLTGGLACSGQDAPQEAPEQAPQQAPEQLPPQQQVPQETAEQTPPQTPLQKVPTGMLSGTVYCADTNLPARGASIYLFQISDAEYGSRSGSQTDLDGRFSMSDVAEGEYYVIAVLPGYMNLLSSLAKTHLDAMTPEERKQLLTPLARTTVSTAQPAQVSVRLERAAGIDGTVTYDDGSPAIGLRVSYKPKIKDSRAPEFQSRFMDDQVFGQNGPPTTDDQGHFRILGVPPGEYVVYVTVPLRSSDEGERGGAAGMLGGPFDENELDVFVGGSLRESKTEIIKVDAGGPSKNADITIPLSKLHTLRGQVLLKSSGQPPVSANVQLLYADSKEQVRSIFAPGGKFEIFYVPEENYILRAAAGIEPPPDIEEVHDPTVRPRHVIWHFPQADDGSPELPLQVTGDIENISISVPDPGANKKAPFMEINAEGDGFGSSSHDR